MSEFGYLTSILLGAVQGLTEFLPISSSGHLALIQRWLGLEANAPPMLLFDVLAHLGTLIAVMIVFAPSARRFVTRLFKELSTSGSRPRFAWRIAGLAIVATIPTAVIGLGFQDAFEAAFGKPRWIGVALWVTGGLLAVTAGIKRPSRGWKRFRWWQAALVGVLQGLAILPGISRSGATICVALFCGLRRRWAAEFSFLIAVPAMLGAALLKTKDTLELPSEQLASLAWGPILVGSLGALVIGVVALLILLNVVRRAKLHYFAVYCWLMGTLALAGL